MEGLEKSGPGTGVRRETIAAGCRAIGQHIVIESLTALSNGPKDI